MSKRDGYIEKMKQQLDDINAQIDEFEEKADQTSGEAKVKLNELQKELQDQAKTVQGMIEKLKAASDESWEKLSVEAERVRDAFVHSFNYFKSQL